jgi:hypothetical protein
MKTTHECDELNKAKDRDGADYRISGENGEMGIWSWIGQFSFGIKFCPFCGVEIGEAEGK